VLGPRSRSCAAVACFTAYGVVVIRFSTTPGRRERALFDRVNGAAEHAWLRVPQQWGTPWTLPGVAAVAALRGRRRLAVTACLSLPVVKSLEVLTKTWCGRPRPVHVQPTHRHDDAPTEGGSMPSGHAAIAACGAVLSVTLVPRPAAAALLALSLVSSGTRVRQGAHEPADVLAGLLLGAGVALVTRGALGSTP